MCRCRSCEAVFQSAPVASVSSLSGVVASGVFILMFFFITETQAEAQPQQSQIPLPANCGSAVELPSNTATCSPCAECPPSQDLRHEPFNDSGEPKYWRALSNFNDLSLTELSAGIHAGEPTGLSARFMLSELKALSFQAGWSFRGLSAFHASGDFLLYLFDVMNLRKIEMDGYMGPGVSLKLWQNERLKVTSDGDIERVRSQTGSFGIRVPLGLSIYLMRPATELYLEFAPAMGLVPATEFNIDFGAGLLFRFGISKKTQPAVAPFRRSEKASPEQKK